MARISRRHILHAVNASLLAAALAFPAGLTIAATDSQSSNGSHAGVPAQTTDPPPSPPSEPSEPDDPTEPPPSPPDSGPTSPPSDSPEPETSPSSKPSGTPETEPSDPDDTDGQTSDPPPEQKVEIDEATTTLNEEKERVPEELASTVEKLISIISTVKDPDTLPQDRQGVIESAENLSTALAAINDPGTPPELRKDLTAIVKQVTSALGAAGDTRVPAEERSTLILVIKRTTSTLDMICDPKTPQDVRGQMISTAKDTTYVAESSSTVESSPGAESSPAAESSAANTGSKQATSNTLVSLSASSDIARDGRTPPKEREQLTEITQQVSALLKKSNDSGASPDERSEAKKELEDKTSRMKDQQEQSASAQDRPEESLGKAAAFCTSAIFESTPESDLVRGLKKQIPAQWEAEGVKDFWKAKDKSNDTLDVLAQLQNNENTNGPFEVVPLITELAELVPHDKLFGTLGASALSCEQTATYLDEKFGVTVDTWLSKTSE